MGEKRKFDNDNELMDAAESYIANRSVGFLALDENKSASLGSGTLVNFGNIQGVITCAHVLKALQKRQQVGLLLFEQKQDMQKQAAKLQTDLIDPISFSFVDDELNGPDLAFFALPPRVGFFDCREG